MTNYMSAPPVKITVYDERGGIPIEKAVLGWIRTDHYDERDAQDDPGQHEDCTQAAADGCPFHAILRAGSGMTFLNGLEWGHFETVDEAIYAIYDAATVARSKGE